MGILLAQSDTVETAGQTVDVLDRILEGGVPLICLAIAVVFGIAATLLYRSKQKSDTDRIKREAEWQRQWAEREATIQAARAELEQGYREKVEALLREMIQRGEDSQQVISDNTQGLKDMTIALQQLTTRIEYVERNLRSA